MNTDGLTHLPSLGSFGKAGPPSLLTSARQEGAKRRRFFTEGNEGNRGGKAWFMVADHVWSLAEIAGLLP
jgi:hypothetical protein